MALSFSMVRGKTAVFNLVITDRTTGEPMPLTGNTIWFHALVGGVAIDKSTDDGITVTDELNGLADLQIDSADTVNIPATGNFMGPCELVMVDDSTSANVLIDSGNFGVRFNVGTP